MNNASSHFARLAAGSLWAVALGVCLSLPGFASGSDLQAPNATAENGADAFFGPRSKISGGIQPSVAAHASGLVLEFHNTENRLDTKLWYHVGKRHGNSITWGSSQYSDANGTWPTVTLSKEGYVIMVHSNNGYKNGSDLYYKVGKIDPYGDQNQTIQWLTGSIHCDNGFHSSIAINDHGVIVGVHETAHSSTGIYYRVGHLRNPAGGDYTIHWDSGAYGIQYDNGINPHIAMNNFNDVVAVHQVPGESFLHYRRGKINGGQIAFGESKRYDNNAEKPAVALLDNGLVINLSISWTGSQNLYARTGTLSDSNPDEIVWRDPVEIPNGNEADYPAVATAGSYAVETHEQSESEICPFGCGETLYSSVAELCPYSNGTLIMGSGAKVYVVLNGYRYHIPNPETFDALGYQWDKILSLPDYEVNAIPEATPFPSVVPVSGPLNYPDGTLVKGLTSKVYVVLNDCRHWIPDQATFKAMGYDWGKLLSLGAGAEAMPEGMLVSCPLIT